MKIKLIVVLTFIAFNCLAQDSTKTKIKEYYLTVKNLAPIDITFGYKQQLSEHSFFKVAIIDLSANVGSSNEFKSKYYAAGFEIGIEFRKNSTKKMTFYHGPNLRFSYSNSIVEQQAPPNNEMRKILTNSYMPGVSYTLGLLFYLAPHFYLSVETNPMIRYSYNSSSSNSINLSEYTNKRIFMGFNNSPALVSLVYRK